MRLRKGLRPFAWSILVLVAAFCLLMICWTISDTERQGILGRGIIQGLLCLISWMLASLILLVLLVVQASTQPSKSASVAADHITQTETNEAT